MIHHSLARKFRLFVSVSDWSPHAGKRTPYPASIPKNTRIEFRQSRRWSPSLLSRAIMMPPSMVATMCFASTSGATCTFNSPASRASRKTPARRSVHSRKTSRIN